jgi:hypothetical protein
MYKDWLARNRNIVSKWNDMSTVPMECCFGQLALKKVQLCVLVLSTNRASSSSSHQNVTGSRIMI